MTRRQAPAWHLVHQCAQDQGLDAHQVRTLRQAATRAAVVRCVEPGLGVMVVAALLAPPASAVFLLLAAALAGVWVCLVGVDRHDVRVLEAQVGCPLGQVDPHGLIDFRCWPGWRVRTASQWLDAMLWQRKYAPVTA